MIDATIRRAAEDHLIGPVETDKDRVGVIFVHGIGQQAQADTVREFGGAVLRWLQEWYSTRDDPEFCVTSSDLGGAQRSPGPARFTVRIPAGKDAKTQPAQTWIFAEAWWAPRVHAPNLHLMVWWGFKAGVLTLVRLLTALAAGLADIRQDSPPVHKYVIYVVSAAFLWLGYLLIGILGIPAAILFYLLAQLPDPIADKIMGLRAFLLDQIGDFFVYMYDDIQAVDIRTEIDRTVRFLVDELKCTRLAVVAHSGGTLVAYDALSASDAIAPSNLKRIKTLVTFGAALNRVWVPRQLSFLSIVPKQSCRLKNSVPAGMTWLNMWADYDPVVGGKVIPTDPIRPPTNIHVTNWMNILLDHGGYFTNREEFLSRLAQEFDRPGQPQQSRFYPGPVQEPNWKRRRLDRVLTLVSWRLLAMIAFIVVMNLRVWPDDRLKADGETVWAMLGTAPIIGGAIGFVSDHIGFLSPAETFGARLVGVVFWLLVAMTWYVLVTWVLFVPWHMREGKLSEADADAPSSQWPEIAARSAALVAAVSLGFMVLLAAGPLTVGPGLQILIVGASLLLLIVLAVRVVAEEA